LAQAFRLIRAVGGTSHREVCLPNMPFDMDLRAVHWELGNSKLTYESEANERYMSANRDKIVRDAVRARKEPESLQLGKMLRKSHIQLSHDKDKVALTESRIRFGPKKGELAEAFDLGPELRATHIDLGVASDKSGKEWTSVMKSTLASNSDKKFACAKPQGFEQLGEELRKSSVMLHAGRHDFRSPTQPVRMSESKSAFDIKPISKTLGFAATLGKELRTSSIDVAYGVEKTCNHWQSAQHAVMGADLNDKFACKKQKGFEHLAVELRKTSVTLGSDHTIYGTEGNKRPVKDDRQRRPAGVRPGL